MEQIPIKKLKVISPMFSYGAQCCLQPRPTELKGLLRNTYRIANPNLDVKMLYQCEVELFGGQLDKNGDIIVKASPLRIQLLEQMVGSDKDQQRLRLHREQEWFENGKMQKNYPFEMYDVDKIFDLKLSVNYNKTKDDFSSSPFLKEKDPVRWYADLFYLSLILGGIGKRSRRGRGCMTTDELLKISNNDFPEKVAELLNSVCGYKAYIAHERYVKLENTTGCLNDRPYVKEIRFGNQLKDVTKDSVMQYLTKVDQASHDIQNSFRPPFVTGFVGSKRFASSVIVSLAEIKDGIIPVYTFLHAVCKDKYGKVIIFRNADEERNAFIDKIEEGRGK